MFDLNVPKLRVKCFNPCTKVDIINFDYVHDILHQFQYLFTIQYTLICIKKEMKHYRMI